MKVLNLTKGFEPIPTNKEDQINFEAFTFKGGEPHIKIEHNWGTEDEIYISMRIKSFNDLGLLLVAKDAIDRFGYGTDMHLITPYFPGARQDRVMVEGEALTVKIYADIINEMGFNSVSILDPHSDVTPALIDNCDAVDGEYFAGLVVRDISNYHILPKFVIVSPDAGANKKSKGLVKYLSEEFDEIEFELVKCDKTRDVKTGEITGFEVYSEKFDPDAIVLIVDDICDGGGTFLGLAEELKKYTPMKPYLAVSHGIFSKGFKELNKAFGLIYSTDSFQDLGDTFIGDHIYHKGFRPKIKEIKVSRL